MIRVGPLALSLERLWVVLAGGAFLAVMEFYARRHDAHLREVAWNALVIGFVAARVGYVIPRWESFSPEPWVVLYVWQGGFDPFWGILAGGGYTLFSLRNRKSIQYAIIAAVVGFLVLGLLYRPASAQKEDLPSLSLSTMDGQSFDLASLKGQPLVVNAWATWCPPCRRELPMFIEEASQNQAVVFAFVSQGETADVVDAYLQDAGLTLPLSLLDTQILMSDSLGVQGLPTTLFFNAQGQLVARHPGELSRAQLRDYLARIQ